MEMSKSTAQPENIQGLSRYIPIEVQENIIDMLLKDTDSKSLHTSLVCKHWRVCVYRTAFSSITLHPSSISAFQSLLDSPFSRSPIFTPVQHVSILGQSSDWSPTFSPTHIMAVTSILSHLASLQKVRSVSLRAVTWNELGCDLVSFLSSIDSIHSLELADVHFAHYEECSEFVGRFRSLQQLIFEDLRFSLSPGWDPMSIPPYGLLSNPDDDRECTGSLTLRCCGPSLQKALKWSGVSTSNSRLTLAQFGAQTRVDLDSSALLRDLGPLLNTLEIVSSGMGFLVLFRYFIGKLKMG
ncbi:hypothetical protein E1B28_011793 [Marasmius oreades]|uniref:F-box domain-containing protein n=1 Tax=Marasmius oreades TaxID=181124 RepID=A0A9P7RVG3_9AGAR|nr:uncharacterized protein E1B28_011793 [Marasmius oreades]KAG7090188.1 hypothetical protein E1B28_011793 [Marasmius oreades]